MTDGDGPMDVTSVGGYPMASEIAEWILKIK
jgi:hypothetical protein